MWRLLISRTAKGQSSHSIVMLAVWRVAPSCWNYCCSWCTPQRAQSVLQNLLRTTIWRSLLTVIISPTSFLNQNGPIMPCFNMSTHALHFTECSGLRRTSSGAWDPQNTEFLLLTWPDREKWASSLNHTFWRKSGFSSIVLWNHWHISTRFAVSFCVRVCLIWILYGYNWRSFFKILWMDEQERPNSWEHHQSDFFGLCPTESLTASAFSGDLAVNILALVDFCPFLMDIINVSVSLNSFTQRVIWNLWGKLLKLTFCGILPGQSSVILSPDRG